MSRRHLIFAAWVFSAAATSLAGAENLPTTEPRPNVEPRGKPNKPGRPTAGEEVRFSDTERQHFEEFMKSNSPRKWATYQQVLARGPEKPRAKQLQAGLAGRYRELENIRQSDAKRHEFEVQAIRIEDEAYGVLQQLHSNREPEANEAKLRELAGTFVDNRHAWREVRIARVKEELNHLGMKKAAAAIREEAEKEEGGQKKSREEQVVQLVVKWKQGANQPKLKGPLPGGDRPPIGENPATEPAGTITD